MTRSWTSDALLLSLVDWGFGLSAIGWAVRIVFVHGSTIVGSTLAALNLAVGVLLLVRRTPARLAGLRDSLLCLGSLVASGVVLKLAPPPEAWPLSASILFAAGGLGALLSLASLGTSFGVLPALRGLVARGPYRWIRHPAYACETLLVVACALADLRAPWPWLAAAVAVALLVLRVRLEERLLRLDPAYLAYETRVPWRLLPGVW